MMEVSALIKFKAEQVEVENMETCEICEGEIFTKGWEVKAAAIGSPMIPVFFICTGCVTEDNLRSFLR